MLFFKSYKKRYSLELSKELSFIIIVQEAAKIWSVKVGGRKKFKIAGEKVLT